MILRLLCAKVVVAKVALTAAFALGAVAGAAAVAGACAARRGLTQPATRDVGPPAT
ncbi:MAG: hypothetical protein ACK4PG_16680 [Acetobacteraceae bacterium]